MFLCILKVNTEEIVLNTLILTIPAISYLSFIHFLRTANCSAVGLGNSAI